MTSNLLAANDVSGQSAGAACCGLDRDDASQHVNARLHVQAAGNELDKPVTAAEEDLLAHLCVISVCAVQ